MAPCKLDFRNDGGTLRGKFFHERCRRGDTRRLDHFVGVENQRLGVSLLLEGDAAAGEFVGIARGDTPGVGKEYVHAEFLAEDGGTDPALSSAENHKAVAGGLYVVVDIFFCFHM